MPKKPKTKPAAKAPKPEATSAKLPDWLIETPMEAEYALTMDQGGLDGDRRQSIELTRKEFLILKVFLAKMRGVQVPSEETEDYRQDAFAMPVLWSELKPEEIAAVPEAANA